MHIEVKWWENGGKRGQAVCMGLRVHLVHTRFKGGQQHTAAQKPFSTGNIAESRKAAVRPYPSVQVLAESLVQALTAQYSQHDVQLACRCILLHLSE